MEQGSELISTSSSTGKLIPNAELINSQFPNSSSSFGSSNFDLKNQGGQKYDLSKNEIVETLSTSPSIPHIDPIEQQIFSVSVDSANYYSKSSEPKITNLVMNLTQFYMDWSKILEKLGDLKKQIQTEFTNLNNFLIIMDNLNVIKTINNYPENHFHNFKQLYLKQSDYYKHFNLTYDQLNNELNGYKTIFSAFCQNNKKLVAENVGVENQMNFSKYFAQTNKDIHECEIQLFRIYSKYTEKIVNQGNVNSGRVSSVKTDQKNKK